MGAPQECPAEVGACGRSGSPDTERCIARAPRRAEQDRARRLAGVAPVAREQTGRLAGTEGGVAGGR